MTAATEIAASGPLRRPAWLTDDAVRKTVVVLAALAVPIGFALHQFIRPFPWLGAGLIFFLAAATRTFGIPLPGKGFASFTVGPAMAGVAALGWAAGGLVVGLGVFAGDLAVRRLPLRNAVGNASHFVTASCVAGTVYYSVASGGIGAGALGAWNTWRLALFIVMFLIVANSTFYLQLRLSPAIAWVDARLTLRWETAVAVMATLLTIAGMHLAYTPTFSRWYLVEALTLAGLVVFAHWLVRRGAMGDSLELVQRLTRLISARAETREALRDIEGLTRSLVPWEEMRIAAYDAAADELVIVASTSPEAPSGARLSAREGLAGLALRTGRPVTTRDADRLLRRALSAAGSEVALPLKHGSRLVGLWSVRHSRTDMYREYDASLLEPVAPQLALALSLDALIQPVLSATEHMGRHVDSVTATTEQLHASAQETAGTARRLAATVRTMSQTLAKTVEEARTTQAIADGTVTEGQDTQQSGAEMLSDARAVREATVSGAAQLTAAADTVMATAEEVSRLQAVSGAVQRFGQTITALADQTGLLALNAAIEAARAGAHGSGFAVVAQEIRALADRSAEEADGMNRAVRDIGALLERATALMERTRADVLGVAEASGAWVSGLDRIVAAAERVVAAGDRIVSAARGSAKRSALMERALTSAQEDVSNAAAETDVVAGASTQQESAIGALNEAATQLSLTAEELLAAVSAVREVGNDARTADAATPAPGNASASAAPGRAGSQ